MKLRLKIRFLLFLSLYTQRVNSQEYLSSNQNIAFDSLLYQAFPSVCLMRGRMYLKYTSRINRSHIDTTGGVKYKISNNFGKTWASTERRAYWKCHYQKLNIEAIDWEYVDSQKSDSLVAIERKVMDVMKKQ